MALLKGFEAKFQSQWFVGARSLNPRVGVVVLATPLWSRPAERVIPHEHEHAWVDPDRSFDAETLTRLHEAGFIG
jgi:hypothetical protein